ncbi:MAG: amidohydrolase, partial [Ignavibacteriales bacterium]|nr:amidohydrolase [Ignavibacteriales bacterium]
MPLLSYAQRTVPKAPPRAEGEGPFNRLIIRGATLIDGTGAPPFGPVDIVVEKNRITSIRIVGYPGLPISPQGRVQAQPGDKELNAEGMYVLPGFIDMHAHMGGVEQGTTAEYVFKLWMGHGITTIRDPGCGNGAEWALEHKQKSERNEITAPRIKAYFGIGLGAN